MVFQFRNKIIILLSISWSIFAGAQELKCDQLAASPKDSGKTVPGISYLEINPRLAIPACKEAIEKKPGSGRFWFQYGRALVKGNQISDAIVAYQQAEKLNHPIAINNIGELYRDGKGFQKDLKKAEYYFSKAAKLGSTEGRNNLDKLTNHKGNDVIQIEKADNSKTKNELPNAQTAQISENISINTNLLKGFNDVVGAAASMIDKSPGFLDVYVYNTNPNDVIICTLLGIWITPTITAAPNKFPESAVKMHALNKAAAMKAYKEILNKGRILPDYITTFGRGYASLPQATLVKDYFPMCEKILVNALKFTNPEYYSNYKNKPYTP